MSWRETKETDAILQRQVVPVRPMGRERGWPSLTRTDTAGGKRGNCCDKSGTCFFLGFLHAARGSGCTERLLFSSALTRCLELPSASARDAQVGPQRARSFCRGNNFATCFPFLLLCFPPSLCVSHLQIRY